VWRTGVSTGQRACAIAIAAMLDFAKVRRLD
jgi:hypothetical protein